MQLPIRRRPPASDTKDIVDAADHATAQAREQADRVEDRLVRLSHQTVQLKQTLRKGVIKVA